MRDKYEYFLDTTVTFSDPFFKKNFNRNLLKLARDYKDYVFYMSEIVYKETKNHFEKNVINNLEKTNKTENKLQNYRIGYFETSINIEARVEQMTKEFETFYDDLQKEGLLYILTCPNHILPDLIVEKYLSFEMQLNG